MSPAPYTVLIVPGLRDHIEDHWQTHLAVQLPRVRTVPPLGNKTLDLAPRLELIEREAGAIDGPIILVAHSAGVPMVVHWARHTRRTVLGALLAAPADIDRPLPEGYPTRQALDAAGWLPVPHDRLPFPAIVAASRNDHLARYEDVTLLAQSWGAKLDDLGEVGHLNPASGYGPWLRAEALIAELASGAA